MKRQQNKLFALALSAMLVTGGLLGSSNGVYASVSASDVSVSSDAEAEEAAAQESPTTLIVGTFNIDVKAPENDVNEQRELMSNAGVEIFGIQEVDSGLARYDQERYDPLVDFQKGPYVDSYFGRSVEKGTGGYGNGIVSAYELTHEYVRELYGPAQAPRNLQDRFIEIYKNYDPESEVSQQELAEVWGPNGLVANGAIEPRSYSRAVFEKDGKEIAFYSTHLSVESAAIRTRQLEELKVALDRDYVEYKIIVGDFNTDQGINEFNVFDDGYNKANGNNGVWIETIQEEDIARQSLDTSMAVKFLDNIIVSDNITVGNVEAIHTDLSDHYPLVAELTLD